MCRLRQHYELETDADAVPVHDVQSQIRAEFGRELIDKEVSLISEKAFSPVPGRGDWEDGVTLL